jgi:hypothetical protein
LDGGLIKGIFEDKVRRYELFPNETIPNVKIPNPENVEKPERKNPENT